LLGEHTDGFPAERLCGEFTKVWGYALEFVRRKKGLGSSLIRKARFGGR
jgi:hypothetical protein